MVDFSLTEADAQLVAMARREKDIGRRHARYMDKHEEVLPQTVHPDVAHLEDPGKAVERLADQTSGPEIVRVLMTMESAADAPMRDTSLGLGSMILSYAGTEEQKQAFGHLRLSIAMTEPSAGSDPAGIRTSAKLDPEADEWVLNGEKMYCGAIGTSDGALVMARGEPDEIGERPFMAFVVPRTTPGFTYLGQIEKMGLRATDVGNFVMQDMRLPALNKLPANFAETMRVFNSTRPNAAAGGLGYCRSLLDFTLEKLGLGAGPDYGRSRNDYGAAEARAIELEALWEAARLSVLHAKWLEKHRKVTKVDGAKAKVIGGNAARRISQGCIELLGPEGLSEDHLAEKWFRDARIYDIFEGAGEVNRLLIARHLFNYTKRDLR